MSRDLWIEVFWLVVCGALLVGMLLSLFLGPFTDSWQAQIIKLLTATTATIVLFRTVRNMRELLGRRD